MCLDVESREYTEALHRDVRYDMRAMEDPHTSGAAADDWAG